MAAALGKLEEQSSTTSKHQDRENVFRIGTRESLLAKVQTDEVIKELKQAYGSTYQYEIVGMTTTGDRNQATALHKFNEKALWTQELEVLLQSGDLDLIVHSLKDMPTQLPHDLELGCVTKRNDPRDVLVMKPSLLDKYKSLADLPQGSVVGTSSLRRIAQLKRRYPQLEFASIRGNMGTRLAKLDKADSEYSAMIAAAAGLLRLGMGNRITTYLSKENGGMLYAVGQGALGIETRKDDQRVSQLLSKIGCERTRRQALAERSVMRTLEGGCSVPIGIETEWVPKRNFSHDSSGVGVKPAEDYHKVTGVAVSSPENDSVPLNGEETLTDEMSMRAIVVSLDGQEAAEIETRRLIASRDDAEQFGWDAARMLVEKGAEKILKNILLNRDIVHEQGEA